MRALALALLVACGAPPQAATTPPSNHVASPPVARGNLRPGVSVGFLKVGVPRAEVHRLLGEPPPDPDPEAAYDEYPALGVELMYTDEKVTAIHVYSAVKGGYETLERTAFPLRGPHGITWGSTKDEVIQSFGKPRRTGDLSGALVPSEWIDYQGVMFDFILADHRLFHVVVGGDDKDDEPAAAP